MRKQVDLGDRKVSIIGTAHISEESIKEVEETIEDERPDLVGVELDESRYSSLTEESGWSDMDIVEAIRDGKGPLLLINLILSIYQRRMGLEQGVKPGTELLAGVDKAKELGIDYKLLDREISETFSRMLSELTLWEKAKLVASLFAAEEDIEVEDLKEDNMLNNLIKELEEEFPTIKQVFLDERNEYMAEKLLEEDFNHAVVVVGAAHAEGLKKCIEEKKTYSEADINTGFPWFKALKYGMPAFIIAGLGYSFFKIGFSAGVNATGFWILSNGILAMLGAIVARASPITWICSFLAAPLTSLDPALGAGMVAAYVEGKVRPPTVGETEDIAYVEGYLDLWDNQVGRILLTFFFVTMGSALATFLSAGYIATIVSGL
ncbi:MAG: TraB/GumN family protein [Candidatus Nanohalobium sp.]